MNTADLTALLDRLRAEPREAEWLEFKANRYEPQALGEYLSALANSACLLGMPRGYLVFGIEDGSHSVVGTSLDPQAEKGKGEQLLPLWLSLGLQPNVGFEMYSFIYHGKRVVLFEVHPAFDRPVKFYLIRKNSQLARHAGMECRHPGHRDVRSLRHPWPLDSGNPCRKDDFRLS
jgi:ATP-dependent DNA helicase RecG